MDSWAGEDESDKGRYSEVHMRGQYMYHMLYTLRERESATQ